MDLKLYNSLTRKKAEFKPLNGDSVSLYTCGPTVYNYLHIGNLRTYVFEDVLRRVLQHNGLTVNHVMNITDVGHLTDDADSGEDKLEKAAKKEGKDVWELSQFYTKQFQKDFAALGILTPTKYTLATDYIEQQIALVNTLEEKGFTYSTSDGVYFDTSKFKKYGKLMGEANLKGLQEGARVEKNSEKLNPTDFALWKFSPKDSKRQMEWDSPWGKGFPGWHVECSAMAQSELGDTIDIHCGGIDHIPVHHSNEIAQSEAAAGKPFAKWWCHGEFLVIDEARMGKSKGNFITLGTLVKKNYDPLAYRYLLLQTHYRKQLNFTWESLDAAQKTLEKMVARLATVTPTPMRHDALYHDIEKALNDDLNAPKAIGIIWKALKKRGPVDPDIVATILLFDDILGLDLAAKVARKKATQDLPKNIQKLLDAREDARLKKNWEESDALRE